MGNAISTSSPVGVLSFISIVLGFITFIASFLTFLNVFWSSLGTATHAQSQVATFLGGVGIALREERNILRHLKRRARQRARTGDGGWSSSRAARQREAAEDEAVWQSLEQTVKGLCQQWTHLERPFRRDVWDGSKTGRGAGRSKRTRARSGDEDDSASGDDGEGSPPPHPFTHRRGSGRVPAGVYNARNEVRRARSRQGRWTAPPEYGREENGRGEYARSDREKASGNGWASAELGETMEMEVNEGRRYVPRMGIGLRWLWVRRKADLQRLSESLNSLQTRRIARQTAGIAMCMNRLICAVEDVEDRVGVIEQRLGRALGIRRVDSRDDGR